MLNKFLILSFFLVFNFSSHAMNMKYNRVHIPSKSPTAEIFKKNFSSFSQIQDPQLSSTEVKKLINYTREYLQKNINRLACQKNESGFIRINVPITYPFSNKIEKIRLNYWAGDNNLEIQPESIHNHPRYFESLIIQGGYIHELYRKSKDSDSIPYDQYRLFKSGHDKSMLFIGSSNLKFSQENKVKQGTIITFPRNLIHRVLTTLPETLSLNVVFKDFDNDENYYDVFISQDGSSDDVKIEREVLLTEDSRKYIKAIDIALKKTKVV